MRYAAFLRAINVGGRNVPMARLKTILESHGLHDVRTVIASGNVVFDSPEEDPRIIETQIESALKNALGWVVDTFVRTPEELRAIVDAKPFPAPELDCAGAFLVAFLHAAPDAASQARLRDRESEIDRFEVRGSTVYWLCVARQSESEFSNAVLEKVLGVRTTMRGIPTLEKVLALLE